MVFPPSLSSRSARQTLTHVAKQRPSWNDWFSLCQRCRVAGWSCDCVAETASGRLPSLLVFIVHGTRDNSVFLSPTVYDHDSCHFGQPCNVLANKLAQTAGRSS